MYSAAVASPEQCSLCPSSHSFFILMVLNRVAQRADVNPAVPGTARVSALEHVTPSKALVASLQKLKPCIRCFCNALAQTRPPVWESVTLLHAGREAV